MTSNRFSLRRAARAFAFAAFAAASFLIANLAQAASAQNNNLGLKTIPFRVTNHTGHPGKLFVYVIGLVPSQGNKAYYQSNVNGDVTIVPQADPPGVSLALDLGRAESTVIQLPQLEAMRIYFSLGQPLLVNASARGAPPSSPPGWVKTDPNFNTIFDWAEITWNDDPPASKFKSTFGGNATQVDMFGLAMLIVLRGKGENEEPVVKKAGFADGLARQKIFADFANAGPPWSRLIMGANRAFPLRVVSPYLGIDPLGVFGPNYLRSYINDVWQKYSNERMIAPDVEGRIYHGAVILGDLVFTQVAGPGPADPPFKFQKPSTETAFRNEINPIPNPPGPGAGARSRAVGALLGAGFMRTNLLQFRNLKACRVGQFYRNDPVNVYARIFHKYALDHLAYSFGFDDTCEQSSFIQVHDPSSLEITLQGF